MTINKWIKQNTSNLTGKTIAITGSTGGIGSATCQMLATLNANLILIDRNQTKANKLKAELLLINPNIKIEFECVDLEDFSSVKLCAEHLKDKKIDILILNAGAYAIPRKTTDLGYDNVFQINFLSPYYLVKTLVSNLKQSNAKVILTSSIAHNYSKLNEKNIDFSGNKKVNLVYGNSKRFITFSLMELLQKNKIKFSLAHPGITFTNITNHYPKWVYNLIKYPMKALFISNKKAALNLIKAVFDETNYMEWIGPSMFNIWGYPKKRKLKTCNQIESQKIFEIAETIYSNINK